MTSANDALVAFLAARPDAAQFLYAHHQNDGTGHCRVCSEGGQTGRLVWPCPLAAAAATAVSHRPARSTKDRQQLAALD